MKIDKNKPIPKGKVGGQTVYPFREMEIGDSIFCQLPQGSSMYAAARVFQNRNPEYKMAGRVVTEDGIEGYRVWRIT